MEIEGNLGGCTDVAISVAVLFLLVELGGGGDCEAKEADEDVGAHHCDLMLMINERRWVSDNE